MSSGLALQIKNKYPKVYEEYKKLSLSKEPKELLGGCQVVEVSKDKYVVNILDNYIMEEMVSIQTIKHLEIALRRLKDIAVKIVYQLHSHLK